MIDSAAKETSKWGDGLPSFIFLRMQSLNMKPTMRGLAAVSGVPAITLHRNFHGERAMQFETAKKLAKALKVSLDELALHSLVVE